MSDEYLCNAVLSFNNAYSSMTLKLTNDIRLC